MKNVSQHYSVKINFGKLIYFQIDLLFKKSPGITDILNIAEKSLG